MKEDKKINSIDYIENLKNKSTKIKRRELCLLLKRNKSYKEYIKVLRANDEEIEEIFQQLYNEFLEDVITRRDFNE